ncbi:D-Ala-D-Ala carboxypeptidase family metallohydrolase [Sandarakinorhabdus limnophila]|uniref:D-Ala-D-Ala carboxypeptidase family metallohydrolase n=1 Tax=Sandarakinorhabdus limnophila TaxID=210512 RepID=UPI0026EAAACB|nr:D-Ala-D-Ala carboxypeptidase family metallohydrolase [Sandarakinorhabdus limnophila]MCM0031890.1 D-Ala-D-Ala carboxypeptidase family metallohydrolase [Sandarakinorhabdus limnophila]
MGDLTQNFSLKEFLVSSTADQLGLNNTPTAEHLRRIREVVAPSLQKIRDLVGASIVITSAYRSPSVNRAVRGVPNSDHAQAWAVDCHAAGLSILGLARFIRDAMQAGQPLHGLIDQLIFESGRGIVHISFAPRKRGMILTQRGGPGTPFQLGIQP